MKGISPVIATILLLLITVAIVGLSFSFFSRVTTSTAQATETQTNQQISQMSKVISIDAVTFGTVTVRNVGTVAIPVSEITVYVNGTAVNCGGSWSGSINTQNVNTCSFGVPPIPCTKGQKIRVVSPANSMEIACPV